MKKFTSLLLTAVLLAAMLSVFAVPASAEESSAEESSAEESSAEESGEKADGFAFKTGIEPAQVRTTVAASGSSRFSVDNKVDTVVISKLEFDANGNVVISLDPKTSAGAVDPAATAIYDLDTHFNVTVRIYRKTDLASAGWGEPVATEPVEVGGGPVTISVPGEKSAQAYYRVGIIEEIKEGSVLSEGNIWIIAIIAVVVAVVVAALIIVKKKKKPAVASGESKDEE